MCMCARYILPLSLPSRRIHSSLEKRPHPPPSSSTLPPSHPPILRSFDPRGSNSAAAALPIARCHATSPHQARATADSGYVDGGRGGGGQLHACSSFVSQDTWLDWARRRSRCVLAVRGACEDTGGGDTEGGGGLHGSRLHGSRLHGPRLHGSRLQRRRRAQREQCGQERQREREGRWRPSERQRRCEDRFEGSATWPRASSMSERMRLCHDMGSVG